MAATVVTSDGERFVLEEDVAAQCGMIGDFTSGTFACMLLCRLGTKRN